MKDNFDLKNLKKPKKINSKAKGNKYENDLAKMLNTRFNTTDFARTPGSGAFATTHKLPSHLVIYGDLITPLNFRFVVEAKKGYNNIQLLDLINDTSILHGFITQNAKDCERCDKDSLVVLKQDRKKALAFVTRINSVYDIPLECQRANVQYALLGNGKHVMLLLEDLLLLPDYIFLG
jgi:hypothetical protein